VLYSNNRAQQSFCSSLGILFFFFLLFFVGASRLAWSGHSGIGPNLQPRLLRSEILRRVVFSLHQFILHSKLGIEVEMAAYHYERVFIWVHECMSHGTNMNCQARGGCTGGPLSQLRAGYTEPPRLFLRLHSRPHTVILPTVTAVLW
jgi:hypothetical protein